MNKDILNGIYTVLQEEKLPEVNGVGYRLEHNKTKARFIVIENDDDNKVFSIAFRTPPSNSKGIQHIVEHTVLCGSKKYPVKDPFVELCKGSLNTFLNAITYPDRTVYPIASCNLKDFRNIMDVYLDAVFNPDIYKHEEIFKQEGWHYELSDENAPLIINGVVYNEMKGAYSSADSLLAHEICKVMFPDSVYSLDSGGDPVDIPTLTREEYLEYHKNFYHPSNSYTYLYGDKDFAEELLYIDKEYLSDYDYLYVPSEIENQKAFESEVEKISYYPITEAEDEEDNTMLSYNVLTGDVSERIKRAALNILLYAIAETPGSPLREALINSGICADIDDSYDTDTKQSVLSIIAYNSNPESKEMFYQIIEDTLRKLSEEGIDKKSLYAAITSFEFKAKEDSSGRFPKGLLKGLSMLGTWVYDEENALDCFNKNYIFKTLREKVEEGYFEKLIKEEILDNKHKSIVVMAPRKGMLEKNENELRKKLDDIKASMTPEEINAVIEDTKALKIYQSTPSPDEDLEKIPLLELEDIEKKAKPFINEKTSVSDTEVIWHDIFTNDIAYINLRFDVRDFDKEKLLLLSLYTEILTYVDTAKRSYMELSQDIDINMGGLSFSISLFENEKTSELISDFSINFKCFFENVNEAFSIVSEVLFDSKLDDKKRLKEIIAEVKSGMKQGLLETGNLTTSGRALAYISAFSAKKECADGYEFYKYIDELDKNFEEKSEELIEGLKWIQEHVYRKEGFIVSYTAHEKPEILAEGLNGIKSRLSDEKVGELVSFTYGILNEGFKAPSQVQYVSCAGLYDKKRFTGALDVLQVIFSYDYLWTNIRVKGGAYGAACTFSRNGRGVFSSFRDPKLKETLSVYKDAYEYVEAFSVNERDMLKYIIGAISKKDMPKSPYMQGLASYVAYKSGVTYEDSQKTRDEVLGCTVSDIRSLADIIKTVTEGNAICVIGDENRIEENRDIFGNVENLY